MKLEVGKFYKTRDGRKAEVVYINEVLSRNHQVVILIEGNKTTTDMTINGLLFATSKNDSDLVAPWEESPKPKKLYAYEDRTKHVSFISEEVPCNEYWKRTPEYDINYPDGDE